MSTAGCKGFFCRIIQYSSHSRYSYDKIIWYNSSVKIPQIPKILKEGDNLKTTDHKHLHNLILYTVIGVYFFILLAALFFKASSLKGMNLVPFRFITDYLIGGKPLAFTNVAGNVLLFVPMGIYLTILNTRSRVWKHMLFLVLFSAAVEVIQFIFKVGVTDIDDLLLNSIGGFLGICCGWLLRKFFGAKARFVVEILSLITGLLFFALYFCLYFGIFGFRIRIF